MLKDLFKTHYETSDRAVEECLQTHYYKNNVEQCKEAIFRSANALNFKLEITDDVRFEYVLKRQDAEIILSLVKINPIETAVDFTVNTNSLISFGKGKKIISSLYVEADKTLSLKGIALKR